MPAVRKQPSVRGKSIAERVLPALERMQTLSTAECANNFITLVHEIGFAGTIAGAWAGVGRQRRYRFFFVDRPRPWFDFYERNDFVHDDPVVAESRRRISPFWHSEMSREVKLNRRQKELIDAFYAFGWKDVFAVPVHGPGSLQGLVTMITKADLTLTPVDRALLQVTARTVWERCRISEGFGVGSTDRPQLSAREVECLQWAAAGKSDNDIAGLLAIKPATAHFHIEEAKRRLGVRTRIEAVAVGILHGLI